MTKKELRAKYQALRQALTPEQIDQGSLALANQSLQLPIWNLTNYHLFLPIEQKREVNTEFLLHILSGKDKNILLSKSDFSDGSMTHYLLTDNTRIEKNAYHIPEPVGGISVAADQIDVVFIPLLAFDQTGQRVGYGKGFYDRFLALCRPDVVKIGLSLFEAEVAINDPLSTDIPLDYCVTPQGVYTF
ncbi:5-formyltetrahydrofolate cyclo-ligase [Flavobacterium sp. JP2137]|uniref:5-formyltetrahydrofolate cyclo-ligase n=1 Tax=Flavobacterium sp. JP2137 TaxID=3414510 RepID=UPI003D2FFF5B